MLAGSRRILACRLIKKKKDPTTPEILSNLVENFAQPGASLADVRPVAICWLGFAGFLHYSKIANLHYYGPGQIFISPVCDKFGASLTINPLGPIAPKGA